MQRGADWYKREPNAFLSGVQGMGPELIGVYAVLLDLIYARGGDTKRDDHHLAGILGCSKRKAKSLTDRLIELGKIQFHDGFVTNSRAKREAKTSRDISEARAKAGRVGGERSGESRKNKALFEANGEAKRSTNKRREEKSTKEDKSSLGAFAPCGELFHVEQSAPKPADITYSAGIQLLTAQGMDRQKAASFLGKLRKEHGEESVARVVTAAVTKGDVGDARSWMVASLKRRSGSPEPPAQRAEFKGMW